MNVTTNLPAALEDGSALAQLVLQWDLALAVGPSLLVQLAPPVE